MSVVNISHEGRCCGCHACAAACPTHCITMQADGRGVITSAVDLARCTECGLCERVCPVIDTARTARAPRTAYAAWSRDDATLRTSTSGGAATVLSRKVIGRGGVVYGCEAKGLDIRHVRIDSADELSRLQGSKYVESDLSGVYAPLRDDLRQGREVLFIGMPCQAAAIGRFAAATAPKAVRNGQLKRVDLVCHGVPTRKMLRDHISCLIGCRSEQRISCLSFRRCNDMRMHFEVPGMVYDRPQWEDLYFRSFLTTDTMRPNCYRCPFAATERHNDLTIGDFWGLGDGIADRPDPELGTSLMIPVSEAGEQLMRECADTLRVEERTLAEAVRGNEQLQHPVRFSLKARLFHALYPHVSFDVAAYLTTIPSRLRTLKALIINRLRK